MFPVSWGPRVSVRFWWEPPPYRDAWWQRVLLWLLRKQIAQMEADERARHEEFMALRRAQLRSYTATVGRAVPRPPLELPSEPEPEQEKE